MDRVISTKTDDVNQAQKAARHTVRVCLIDYGCGNIRSVFNVIERIGISAKISNDVKDMDEATHLILPGVGAFGEAMDKLRSLNIIEPFARNVLDRKKPFLGICVGMQILASQGTEHGLHDGLGWIPGIVEKMDVGNLPLPHVGWNNLNIRKEIPVLKGVTEQVDFYFVHSFHLDAEDQDCVNAVFDYGKEYTAVVSKDNIVGIQFHPEKSQKAGQLLLKN